MSFQLSSAKIDICAKVTFCPVKAYYVEAEVDNTGAMAVNYLAAIFTFGGVKRAISHHWIIIEIKSNFGTTHYKRYEFANKSYEGDSWNQAMKNKPSGSYKDKNYTYRSPKITKTKNFNIFKSLKWRNVDDFVNNYISTYGSYHNTKNNCQHFAKRTWAQL